MIRKIDVNIKHMVYDYPTKSEEGFTQAEINSLISWFPTINTEKFDDAMTGNTCMMINDDIIHYPCDVYKALRCGLEGRDLTLAEFD